MDIYREHVLDHYKNPRNQGEVKNPDFKAKENNIFCGDWVEVSGTFEKEKIDDVKFKGKGCVISQASASLLTEAIQHKSPKRVEKMNVEDVVELLGVSLSPTRMKCAELPLIALKRALGFKK